MYTILVNDQNELVTSVKEKVMQRSKLIDHLHFLVPPDYKGIDMSDFTVMLEYLTPVGREYKSETLTLSEELYKDMLEYKVPFDTALTKEPGPIELQLTFIKVDFDPEGESLQQVRKTSTTVIDIIPIAKWSDVIADDSLNAIDQRLIQSQALINQLNEMMGYLDDIKADNVKFDEDTRTLQLTSHGTPIGNQVEIANSIVSIVVDEDGNMVLYYADGKEENLGKIGECNCPGTYIPNYTDNGMLTFTLSKTAGEENYEFDIQPGNDWSSLDEEESTSLYIWEEL